MLRATPAGDTTVGIKSFVAAISQAAKAQAGPAAASRVEAGLSLVLAVSCEAGFFPELTSVPRPSGWKLKL